MITVCCNEEDTQTPTNTRQRQENTDKNHTSVICMIIQWSIYEINVWDREHEKIMRITEKKENETQKQSDKRQNIERRRSR